VLKLAFNLTKKLNSLSSKKLIKNSWYSFNIMVFLVFIFIPTLFVLVFFLTRIEIFNSFILSDQTRLFIILKAVFLSFAVSLTVTAIDLIFGFSIAWVLAKRNFFGKELINTLIESPLAIPTAGLGFSVALFWAQTPNVHLIPFGAFQIFDNIFVIIVLFHFTTTFPYVVRSLSELLEEIDKSYEIAALTCGASRFTAARTITLPMFRSGISTAAILSMAKSLSDTGGVVTLLTTIKGSKLIETDSIQGTVLIDIWKGFTKTTDVIIQSQYEAALAFVSFLMITLSIIILFFMKWFIRNVKAPKKQVYPEFEKRISTGIYVHMRNSFSFGFITLFVFVPSFFILAYLLSSPVSLSSINWSPFLAAIFNSFAIATIATVLNVMLGLTIGIFITRKHSRFSTILDALIDVPYLVPSAALGISVFLFWKSDLAPIHFLGFDIPDFILVVFAHMSMIFPFITRNIVGGLEEFDVAVEETARTLGAKPYSVFKDLTLPAIKGSILAGAVMAFTRSVGETGATLAVSSLETAPVFIVNQIKAATPNYGLAALTTLVLTIIGYTFIMLSKIILNSNDIKKNIKKMRVFFKKDILAG
jgi:thiamine transport system permease protein